MPSKSFADRLAVLERGKPQSSDMAQRILETLMAMEEATAGEVVDHLREGQAYDKGGVLSETSRPAEDHWYYPAWLALRTESLAKRAAA
jgi:hypothetical protein